MAFLNHNFALYQSTKVVLHAKYALKAFKRNTAKAEENLKSYLTVVIFVFRKKMGRDRSQIQQCFENGRLEIYRGKMGTQDMQRKIFQRALLGVTKSDI